MVYYVCKRCGDHKELRKSKNAVNPLSRYRDLEKKIAASEIVQLHKTRGTRNLCPPCLRSLVVWQAASAVPKRA